MKGETNRKARVTFTSVSGITGAMSNIFVCLKGNFSKSIPRIKLTKDNIYVK